jgi:hypothetical protein
MNTNAPSRRQWVAISVITGPTGRWVSLALPVESKKAARRAVAEWREWCGPAPAGCEVEFHVKCVDVSEPEPEPPENWRMQ